MFKQSSNKTAESQKSDIFSIAKGFDTQIRRCSFENIAIAKAELGNPNMNHHLNNNY